MLFVSVPLLVWVDLENVLITLSFGEVGRENSA